MLSQWANTGGSGVGGFPYAKFVLGAQSTIIPTSSGGSSTPTFTRATTATVVDFEGRLVTVPSGAARFQGARFVSNLCPTSSASISVAGNKTITVAAGTFVFSMGAEATGTSLITFTGTATGSTGTLTANATSRTSKTLTITVGGTIIATCTVAAANNIQFEEVTGQANQNPSSYKSVGVLSAPFFGAGIDGAAWESTTNANTVSGGVVTEATGAAISSANSKFAVAGTVVGDCYTTPAAAANQIAGSFDIDVLVAMDSWSTNSGRFTAKDVSGNRQFGFAINNGAPSMEVMDTAGNVLSFATVSTVSFAAGTQGGVRALVTWALSGNCLCDFSSSADGGVTWTAVGTQVAVASTGNAVKASSQPLYIGQRQFAGAESHLTAAKIYRVRMYNGNRTTGTLAVNFNANDFSSGTTWTASTTGETWTINGNAKVFGGSGTSSIAAPWDANGPQGYLSEGAGTQILATADIRDMTTANWTLGATMTRARTSVGIDGASNTATRLTGGAVAATNIITTAIVAAATSRTYSAYVKRVTGTGIVRISQDNFATNTDITSQLVNGSWVLIQLNQTQLNAIMGFKIDTSTDAIDVDCNQFESGAFATSRMLATGAARNADVLTFASAGNVSGTVGTVYAEIVPTSFGGTNGFGILALDSAGNRPAPFVRIDGYLVMYDGTTETALGAAPTVNIVNKVASVWGASSMNCVLNASAIASAAFDGDMNVGTNFLIGGRGTGAGQPNQLYGTIRNIRIFNRALSSAQLAAMTT